MAPTRESATLESKSAQQSPWPTIITVVVSALVILAAAVYVGKVWGDNGPILITVAPGAEEAGVLESQLAEMRRSEDRLLTTILAALGIVATVLVAFTAIAAYLSAQNYQRDKEAMQSLIQSDTDQKIAGIQATESAERSTLRSEVLSIVKETGRFLDERNTRTQDQLSQLEATQNEQATKILRESMNRMVDNMSIRADISRVSGEVFLTRRDYGNAFASYLSALSLPGAASTIRDLLDLQKLQEILRGATSNNGAIGDDQLLKLENLLADQTNQERLESNLLAVWPLLDEIRRYRDMRMQQTETMPQ